ncbi:MAG TPA: TlpA disulfide reductase family protein [Candidatus Polarisedimenticolia bacterium]|nr:TlpA disulfide reductase family protein [Candidatus Polarisedimenticolia bacterium]
MKIGSFLLLLAALPPLPPSVQPEVLRIATTEPVLVDVGAGSVHWLSEAEFRKAAARWSEDPDYVPLKPGLTGLSPSALFDTVLASLDHTVTLAVDLDSRGAAFVTADLDSDGDLGDDRRYPVRKQSVDLRVRSRHSGRKALWVAEIDTGVQTTGGRVMFRMTFSENPAELMRGTGARPKAILSQSTLRKGVVRGPGMQIAFALWGTAGSYDDDYNAALFDLNGDGKLDPANRASREFFWIWERQVSLGGATYEFSVDHDGSTLTLKPLAEKLPERPSLEVDSPAPDFAFVDFDGKRRHLSDFRGQVLLLDFWGTWCQGCVAHAKTLVAGYRRLHPRGFEILGVHLGGAKEQVEAFATSHEMSWPQTIETGEALRDRPLQRLYRFLGAPNYFLIGRDGTLLANGGLPPESLLDLAEKQLR